MTYNLENYRSHLCELADTVLYEEAIKVIQDDGRNRSNPSHESHKMNSLVYQEFWRREKASKYFQAFNLIITKR